MAPHSPPARFTRRRLLATTLTAASAAIATAALPGCSGERRKSSDDAPRARSTRWSGHSGTSGVKLRWLGANAWDISFGDTTILVDPWLTRFPTGTFTPSGARADTPLRTDSAAVDAYLSKADLILVSHGHFDHLADVPYLARKTGATVIGTESHCNLLRALDVPDRLLTAVSGGQRLRYRGYTVEAFVSAHSVSGPDRQIPFPGTRTSVPPRPTTIADLVEGGTLAYQITVRDSFRIFVLASANYVEQAITGLRPDLVIMPPGGDSPGYVDGLMRALERPTWILPTHWDDFDRPLTEPTREIASMKAFRDAVKASSPASIFVPLDRLTAFTP